MDKIHVFCNCGSVILTMVGNPKIHAYCHCQDCRNLLQVPFHCIAAYEPENVIIKQGEESLVTFNHPKKRMSKAFCKHCGETMYNTNSKGWKLVSQVLIRRCNNNELPEAYQSSAHFFYAKRIVSIDDELPKR